MTNVSLSWVFGGISNHINMEGHFIEEPDFRPEPAFVKELVGPVAALVTAEDATAIYGLLDGKYPVAQVQSLVQRVKQDISNAASRYVYFWTDNDDNGDMMVAFVYAYEGKGYLEYRFFIKDEYPLAQILPQNFRSNL